MAVGGTNQPIRVVFRAKKMTRDKEGHYRYTDLGDIVGLVSDYYNKASITIKRVLIF